MTADYYLSRLKIYSHFVRSENPSQQLTDREKMVLTPTYYVYKTDGRLALTVEPRSMTVISLEAR
ncbi:MAG: hypothetical protein ABSC93_19385 [Bryobacteraceae bacterium]|jgi:hypothetical protein